jgi:4-aminobutyrate aminotransferase-like enzyme/Ser/Thr protein kinase RdoA (MazF antagonist)
VTGIHSADAAGSASLRVPSLGDAPAFDERRAARIAREMYALDARATRLPSERDQNFLLETPRGERLVLKIANAGEDSAMLDAQQSALTHLASGGGRTPRIIRTVTGAAMAEATGADDRRHIVWAVTHLPGITLARVTRRSPALLEDYGHAIGALRRGLAGFDHPAIHRDFYWDLANGRRVVDGYRALVDDVVLGATIDTLVERFDERVAPRLQALRRAAIHNDLNDHNVLVGGGDDLWSRNQRITGIVDFGDMVHSFAIGDLAIAAAYVMLDAPDPLAAVAALVRGHHAESPLDENELAVLPGLISLRLCASACIAADQRRQRPDNAYLDVSQAAIRRTLPALASIPFGLAEAVFRDACGLEASATSGRVRDWLKRNHGSFASVLDADLRTEPCTVLDLSVGSALISGDERENAEPALTRRVFGAIHERGTQIGVGRYDEPRLLYTSSFFAGGANPLEERRTIHIGLDLFDEAGTPVYAPIAGTVHAFADNHAPLDYGPLIILRHETDDGTEFFTLYGHLSRESLEGLRIGKAIARGDRIATMGTPAVNVGWTPHVHLQVITDLLELGTDYPGVARASQRAVWRSLSPDPNLIVGIPAERFPAPAPAKSQALADRHRSLGRNLSVAYREPLRIVRGWKQYLFDDEGRRYLDGYNNVPHVGHAHPAVVRAGAEQMAVLATNTRYLNDIVNEYAARLTATLPEPLRVCYLLNSASEANELALRLARAHTARRDMIVLEAAYHGNTTSLIDLSPYKHGGPGGSGTPRWVHVAPLPDDYRGPWKRDDRDAGAKYALRVSGIIAEQAADGHSIAGFIAESCPSVGGQIMLPPGYLDAVYARVRKAGGVCIADEVQTGLGRIGTHFWAFESQGVVPDIVVMGKPLGNGHPLAAVVTTREIADSFDNGMEFFSTFGGNTVSCAIGLAVLDVMRDERLQDNALAVGEHLLGRLRALMSRHVLIGDVRGSGLFLGVELVLDRETLAPAAAEASYVVDRMREIGILLGTDGPLHNVVKIRPPMPFTRDDAELLASALDQVLGEITTWDEKPIDGGDGQGIGVPIS